MGAETRAQNRQNDWQAEQNQLDRDFQKEMVDYSAELDYNNWLKQFELQSNQWYQQQNYSANIQSQQEREKYQILREQGVNPALAIANGASTGMPMVASPQVPNPSGSKLISGSPSGYSAGIVQTDFQDFASLVQGVTSLVGKGVDATRTFSMLNAELQNKLEETRYKQVLSNYQDMMNEVFRVYGRSKQAADLGHTYAATMLMEAQGDTQKAEQYVKRMQGEYYDILKQTEEKRLPYVVPMLVTSMKNLESMSHLNRSKANEASALSQYYGALTLTEDEMRKFKVDSEHWNSLLSHNEYVFKDATQMQRFEQYVEQTRQAGILSSEMEQALRLATKNNDWYAVRMLLGMIDTGVKAYGTYKGAKAGEGFVNAQDIRNDIDRQYKEYLQKDDDVPSYLKRTSPVHFGY